MSELKPCPFGCVSDIGPRAINGEVFYQCSACICRGPSAHKSFERAAELWNRRFPSLSAESRSALEFGAKLISERANELAGRGVRVLAIELDEMAALLRSLAHREKAQTIHEWLADTAEGK